jgi:ABC-type transport system substrate-binding protein
MRRILRIGTVALVFLMLFSSVEAIRAQEQKYFFTMHIFVDAICQDFNEGYLAPALKDIGINVVIEMVDTTTITKLKGGQNYDPSLGYAPTWAQGLTDAQGAEPEEVMSDPDGLTLWYASASRQGAGFNWMGINDADLDQLLTLGRSTFSQEERRVIYQQLFRYYLEELPCIPMYTAPGFFAFAKGVGGMQTYAAERMTGDDAWCAQFLTNLTSDTYHYSQYWDVVRWLPDLGYAMCEGQFSRLVQIGEAGEIRPDLATSWNWSDTHDSLTFHLRNVTWSDGVPLTSKDVKFSYDLIMNPNFPSPEKSKLTGILSSIETPDDLTVKLNFKPSGVSAGVLDTLAWRGFGVVPEHTLGSVNVSDLPKSDYNTKPGLVPVSGPYRAIEAVTRQYYKWEKNPYWWGPTNATMPKYVVCHIIPETAAAYAALLAGEIVHTRSNLEGMLSDIMTNPNLQYCNASTDQVEVFQPNYAFPPLQNKWVRRAIAYAVDNEKFCSQVESNLSMPTNVPVRSSYWWTQGFNVSLDYPHDVQKAKESMVKAGYDYAWLSPVAEPYAMYAGLGIASFAIGAIATFAGQRIIGRRKKSPA